ncbi:MAG: aminotransferase class IV [Pseudomonadota bacterium]|nr:aminotransferase class IV [Pseudomonadota bacterium]
MNENSICYLSGEFIQLADAKISVLDRGFIFGEGIYEVMAAINNDLLHCQLHFDRLRAGAYDMQLDISMSDCELHDLIVEVLRVNNFLNSYIYLQLTKGSAPRDHFYPSEYKPTLFIMASPIVIPKRLKIVKAILQKDIRWQKCNVKTTSLYANTWAKTKAKSLGGDEAIFHRDGFLTEGATSNLFIVNRNKVLTPKKNEFILPGVTRHLVLKVLRNKKISHEEVDIPVSALWEADELLLTSTTKGVVAVGEVDGTKIGQGRRCSLGTEIFQGLTKMFNN